MDRDVNAVRSDLMRLAETDGISLVDAVLIADAGRILDDAARMGRCRPLWRYHAALPADVERYNAWAMTAPVRMTDVLVYGATVDELRDDGLQALMAIATSAGEISVLAGLPRDHHAVALWGGRIGSSDQCISLTDCWWPGPAEEMVSEDLAHIPPADVLSYVQSAAIAAWRDARRAADLW